MSELFFKSKQNNQRHRKYRNITRFQQNFIVFATIHEIKYNQNTKTNHYKLLALNSKYFLIQKEHLQLSAKCMLRKNYLSHVHSTKLSKNKYLHSQYFVKSNNNSACMHYDTKIDTLQNVTKIVKKLSSLKRVLKY